MFPSDLVPDEEYPTVFQLALISSSKPDLKFTKIWKSPSYCEKQFESAYLNDQLPDDSTFLQTCDGWDFLKNALAEKLNNHTVSTPNGFVFPHLWGIRPLLTTKGWSQIKPVDFWEERFNEFFPITLRYLNLAGFNPDRLATSTKFMKKIEAFSKNHLL